MLRRFVNGLIDVIYPKTCLACKDKLKTPGGSVDFICAPCLAKAKRNLPPFCCSCGRQLPKANLNKNICLSCLRAKLHFDRAFSPYVYEGAIKELIHQFKYKGKDYLSPALGDLMIDFIKEYRLPVSDFDHIVPMPLYKTRLREREFNQAELLSKRIASAFNKSVLTGALERYRNTRTQTELDTEQRRLNVKDSFRVVSADTVNGKNLLLVDDVLTTGATSSEASMALKSAGAKVVFVLTLAN